MRSRTGQFGRVEFGDFQTPPVLADQVCRTLVARGVAPATVVEPTCGLGSLLVAALGHFPAARCLGYDINPAYVESVRALLGTAPGADRGRVEQSDFFKVDWPATLAREPGPLLLLGNPPWVTNAGVGAIGGTNLPTKSNFQGRAGLDAVTGKSNFDISEWMLIRLLEAVAGRSAWIAMLCKTAVARKVLGFAWGSGVPLESAEMRAIDAAESFDAAVDACLLLCSVAPGGRSQECQVFPSLAAIEPTTVIGYADGQVVADLPAYRRWHHLAGRSGYDWRSGVKHDCSKVMELRQDGAGYRNGLGERVELEDTFVFPMVKSSALAGGRVTEPDRWMLVPQRAVGDDTRALRFVAPKTWQYLQAHGEALDRRASSIYRNRPRFSVFGVGDYTFAPWKVAISGFYKKLDFVTVGQAGGKPIVLDDTGYFLGCRNEGEARYLTSLLNNGPAREFFSARVFWDAKRPITIDLLRQLDLTALAREVDGMAGVDRLQSFRTVPAVRQLELFET